MQAQWTPVAPDADDPLADLDGRELAGATLRVELGRTSRFGARYFRVLLEAEGRRSREPVLTGLEHRGPLPSYNWIEVAATNPQVILDSREVEVGEGGIERLWALLFEMLPPGGHLMVEYDSPQRAETAQALAHGVPAIATPLGESLFRAGFGAHFKDWQIAEGGSEGPRKLQAYKPPSDVDGQRWREKAAQDLEAFVQGKDGGLEAVTNALERARRLLDELRG